MITVNEYREHIERIADQYHGGLISEHEALANLQRLEREYPETAQQSRRQLPEVDRCKI
jgi:hypothetical protein